MYSFTETATRKLVNLLSSLIIVTKKRDLKTNPIFLIIGKYLIR